MSNVPFRVVRGEEVAIMNKPFAEGCVYFATDTKRIYMDAYLNGEPQDKLPMGGGNSGIFYAHKGFTDSSDVSFALEDIEGDELPNVNDLIVNYKSSNELRDGFYKVVTANAVTNTVETEYLPVGGGGGGTGGSSGGGKILIKPETPANGMTTLEKGYSIKYSLEVYNNAGAPVTNSGRATFIINGVSVDGGIVTHGGVYDFPITEYLSTVKDTNTITLKITLNTGGIVDDIQTYTWTVKCVDLQLIWDWNYSSDNYIKESTFTLNWKVKGGIECITHIMIDDKDDDDHYFTVPISASQTEASKSLSALDYGAHKFTMWLTAKVGTEDIESDPVNNILTFIGGSETGPILTVPYFAEKATQYDTLNIPFLVYKPDTEKLKVTFYVDNVEVLTDEYSVTTSQPHYWPYTLGHAGEVKLKLAFTAYPEVEYNINLKISPLDLGIKEPTEGLAFSLKASNISGNAQLKQLETEGKLTFSENFDWTNGGLKSEIDENGNVSNYICVRQGTTMTLNYKLFENTQVGTQGKTFKFCFKAMNCYDYEAPVLECYEDNTKLGLKFNAQSALFSSAASYDFTTQYCEGSYIELETEIWPNQADSGNRPGDRFLMFWVDGVPTGVQIFDNGTSFVQNIPKNIVIGSSQCDVYVYVAKVYEKKLSSTEHLNGFILDAPNVNEILARFTRNDIIGGNNEISYEKLVKNNPGCHAYLYELPDGMTTDKNTKKTCNYTEYYLDTEKPILKAKDAKVFVQGTSSAAYGVAAFNVRTDFKKTTMTDGNDQPVEGRKVSETSIPVKYTCTKVNVASCENANNALNAEWYNRFQPYYDGHRRKSTEDKQYRDCMEFDFGVMFVKDHNEKTNYYNVNNEPDETKYPSINVFAKDLEGNDDRAYMASPYYKLYAVANMGNDKKNIEVFHDITNPRVCCVEVLDNQNAEHWMTVYNENAFKEITKEDGTKEGPFYEFRYSVEDYEGENPENITTATQEADFLRFVKWMSECNPNAATNEELPNSVTYEPKTFKGFNPPGYNDSTSSGISLKGFTIKDYAKTYTKDTKEYRIAKMLDECEEHLVMDSVVFHYLFIERHTMVDNVAKNTFWSTEDGEHWDLTKNYDNDTSDGNNNSGYLVYQYGNEIGDMNEGTTTSVFNAINSVWINFIKNLPQAQEELYTQLSAEGAWDAQSYLALFKEKQSLIPERCWIEDYFRKYIRPRRLGLDGSNKFIQRLEGGKKTHQRNQFETYHGYYMDSKYCVGDAFFETGAVDMRLNTGDIAFGPDTVIPVTYYIDLYPSAKIGGQVWRKGQKITRGTPVDVPIGSIITAAGDGTCYFYASNMIQSMKNISSIYPTYIAIAAAKKLRELEAGSNIEGYFNRNLTNAILNDNTQLEKAQLQQVGSASLTGLDLSKLAMLRELKIDMGSTFPTLTLAKGCIIDTLYLNKHLNTLKVKDLQILQEYDATSGKGFKYDEGIFDNLITVLIQDCPALNDFAYQIVKTNKLTNYCFNNILWNVPTSDIDITNGTIQVLENLLQKDEKGNKLKGFVEVSNQTLALTGKIIVHLSDDIPEGTKLNEYAIYAKYKNEFPNLEIEYTGNLNALDAADTITFYNDQDKNTGIYRDIIYQVKTDGTKDLGFLTSSSGPNGVAISTPTKESDKYYDYAWNNTWKDEEGKTYTHAQMLALQPKDKDKIFVAQYDATDHPYTITLRNYDGTDIEHNIGTQKYGTNITEKMPFYLYRHHNGNGMRYEFQGWISAKDYLSGKSDVTPIKEFIVEGDTTYYAFYLEQDCVTQASRMDYFYFSGDGTTIKLKEKYRNVIQEPITLPLMNGDIAIKSISDFGFWADKDATEKNKIPAIYFENSGIGGAYETIKDGAFWSAQELFANAETSKMLLQHIYLPNTITEIGEHAFEGCYYLETVQLPDTTQDGVGIRKIGSNAFDSTGHIQIMDGALSRLEEIGVSAFYAAGSGVVMSEIPEKLTYIKGWAFAKCSSVNPSDFSKVTRMGANAFDDSGKIENINIVLPTDLSGYNNNCLVNYAVGRINTITFVGGDYVDSVTLDRLGITASNPVTIEQLSE